MTRKLIISAVIVVAIGGTLLALNKKAPPPTTATPSAAVTVPTLELLTSDVATVSRGNLSQVLAVSGSLRAFNQVVVKAKVAGEVSKVLVREGESVTEGQVLAQIEQSDYLARLEQSRGALKSAQGSLEIALNSRKNNQQLHQQKFISQNALDNSESQYTIAVANVATAKGALDVAQKALQDTVVKAPMAGIVSTRNVQPGEKVSPDARLLEIVDLRQMEMELAVPSSEIAQLKTGMAVKVAIDGVAAPVQGTISRITPATQAGTRSIMVYVKLENREQVLRAGMFGQASVVLSNQTDVVKVPTSALYFIEGESGAQGKQASVYVIENGKLRQQAVTTGVRGEDEAGAAVEVKSGLASGAQIIRVNLGNLNAGTQVKITAPKELKVSPSANSNANAGSSAAASAAK